MDHRSSRSAAAVAASCLLVVALVVAPIAVGGATAAPL